MTPSELETIIRSVLKDQRHALARGKITGGLLSSIAVSFGCQFATYWQVDTETLQLAPVILWKSIEAHADTLLDHTRNKTLSMSQGTAGHVWRSRRPVWSTNLLRDMCLPRSLEADLAGLHAGIWFALKTSDTVFGVIELLTTELPASSEALLELIEYLGLALGRNLDGGIKSITASRSKPA